MNVQSLNVLVSNVTSKISKKTGSPYQFLTIQGLATMVDGVQQMFTYDIWPEKDKPLPVVNPGEYVPIFGARVHWETQKLEPAFVDFRPLKKA